MNRSVLEQGKAERLRRIAEAAIGVFCELGYRRAHVSDVARAAGVAPGTVYLYVESKEALFDLALGYALRERVPSEGLPLPAPEPEGWLESIRERLPGGFDFPELAAALERGRAEDIGAELGEILAELYDEIRRNRRALTLVERSARDWPELANLFYVRTRRLVVERLAAYLDLRVAAGQLRRAPDAPTAARLILETTAWFAMHRYGDPDSAGIGDDAARATVLDMLAHSLLTR